jgi:hypothetical protein
MDFWIFGSETHWKMSKKVTNDTKWSNHEEKGQMDGESTISEFFSGKGGKISTTDGKWLKGWNNKEKGQNGWKPMDVFQENMKKWRKWWILLKMFEKWRKRPKWIWNQESQHVLDSFYKHMIKMSKKGETDGKESNNEEKGQREWKSKKMDNFWICLPETHGKISKKVENDEKGQKKC